MANQEKIELIASSAGNFPTMHHLRPQLENFTPVDLFSEVLSGQYLPSRNDKTSHREELGDIKTKVITDTTHISALQ